MSRDPDKQNQGCSRKTAPTEKETDNGYLPLFRLPANITTSPAISTTGSEITANMKSNPKIIMIYLLSSLNELTIRLPGKGMIKIHQRSRESFCTSHYSNRCKDEKTHHDYAASQSQSHPFFMVEIPVCEPVQSRTCGCGNQDNH